MRTFMPTALLLAAAATGAAPLHAQQANVDSVTAFLHTVTAAAAKYEDRATAVREGFRRVGPDFPGMGEHWVQPGRLVSGRFRADAPPILTYAVIDERVVLTGVAFAVPLTGSAQPPSFPSPTHWHDHAASVDEESLLIAPAGTRHGAAHHDDSAMRPRLAMLHVWLNVANPDGVFAQDNWALPYARLGVAAPDSVDVGAARALAFVTGSDAYYRELFRAAAPLAPDEQRALDALTHALRTSVEQWIAGQPPGWSVSGAATAHLVAEWSAFWTHVRAASGPVTWERLRVFSPAHY